MAITTLGPHYLPSFIESNADSLSPSLSGITLNASGDRMGFVVTCPKAGTLDKFEFKTGSVTNNPDNGIRLSFQSIDAATGFPDTTQDQWSDITGTLAANTWQVPAVMTDDGTTGGVKRTVTAGEQIACVIDFVSFVASDSFQIDCLSVNTNNVYNQQYYTADASNGTYVKSGLRPNLALKYDDGTYATFPIPYGPWTVISNTSLNTGTTPDEIGNVFQVPISCRILGIWARCDINNSTDFILYDSGGSILKTFTQDNDLTRSINGFYSCYFSSSYTLAANTTYRITMLPTTATSNNLLNVTLPGSGYGTTHPLGTTWQYTSRANAGAFTDDNTKITYMGLIVDGYDTGSGGGAGGGAFTFVG